MIPHFNTQQFLSSFFSPPLYLIYFNQFFPQLTPCSHTATSLPRQPATLLNGMTVLCDTITDGGNWVIIQVSVHTSSPISNNISTLYFRLNIVTVHKEWFVTIISKQHHQSSNTFLTNQGVINVFKYVLSVNTSCSVWFIVVSRSSRK